MPEYFKQHEYYSVHLQWNIMINFNYFYRLHRPFKIRLQVKNLRVTNFDEIYNFCLAVLHSGEKYFVEMPLLSHLTFVYLSMSSPLDR